MSGGLDRFIARRSGFFQVKRAQICREFRLNAGDANSPHGRADQAARGRVWRRRVGSRSAAATLGLRQCQGGKTMLELYHSGLTTCSKQVRHCLREKGLPYKNRYVELWRYENLSPAYLELNPNGVVPTLVHDGVPVINSF